MIATLLASAWVGVYAGAGALAALRARARAAAAATPDASEAATQLVLVRPLAGHEPGLGDRLRETGGATFVVLAVGSDDDGAAAPAHAAAAELRARGIDACVLVTRATAPNHKAEQLARALDTPRARARRVVVVADSDVALAPHAVTRLADTLQRATVDAAWAPPVETGPATTWGDHASQAVLDASLHSFPLLAGIDPEGLVGKLFAVRRGALDDAGGFAPLTEVLGEDMELARRLRATGARIAVAPFVAHSAASGRSTRDVIARYARWLLMVRAQRARLLLSYPLLLAPSPLFLALLAAGIAQHERSLAAVAVAGLVLRVGIACAARTLAGLRLAPLSAAGQALLGDATLLSALVVALSSRELTWRGRRLAITKGGALRASSRRALRREHAHQPSLGEHTEEARWPRDDGREAVGHGRRTDRDPRVDSRELALDALPLEDHTARHVTLGDEGPTERDPEIGALGAAEHVAQAHGQHLRAACDARDLSGPGAEIERGEGRPLAPLGEDPQRAALGGEEARGMTDGARAVGGVVEIDAEGADATEERYTSEVRRIHHRVAVGREEELGDIERDERVPPRRVVGDEEHGALGDEGARLVEPRDEHATERTRDARARMTREPGVEPPALRGLDHEVTS